MSRPICLVYVLLVIVPLLSACGGDDPAPEDTVCVGTEADTYAAGIVKTTDAGLYVITLTEADPAPPEKGENTWNLRITAGDSPLDGADVVLTPFMPEHGHGSSPAYVEALPLGDGAYRAEGLNFSMPGLWEITVSVESPDTGADSAIFAFCIEG